MVGKLPMGQKELLRGKIMEQVKTGPLTLKEAALRLKIRYRQSKRLYRAYREKGDAALIHGNTGRRSHNRTAEEVKERALAAYRERYAGFGPTAETIGFRRGGETGRSGGYHGMRGDPAAMATGRRLVGTEAAEQALPEQAGAESLFRGVGSGVNCVDDDGSHHDWFEGRRRKCCLMNMVDDATGTTLSMLFEQETTDAAMTLLSCWIRTKVREIRHTPVPVLRPFGFTIRERLCQQSGADG
jgi:transposase